MTQRLKVLKRITPAVALRNDVIDISGRHHSAAVQPERVNADRMAS